MIYTDKKEKIEYGDFQTPLELAVRVCQQLLQLNISPDIIIEPTCGFGNFIKAASSLFPKVNRIIGVDINAQYLQDLKNSKQYSQDLRIVLQNKDFFEFDWQSYINRLDGEILVLGNFPWVTNSQLGSIGGDNLPKKK